MVFRWGEGGRLGGHDGAHWTDSHSLLSAAARKRFGRPAGLRCGHSWHTWTYVYRICRANRVAANWHAASDRRCAAARSAALEREKAARTVTLDLPLEFMALCARDSVPPETILRGFIADLCGIISWARDPREDGYSSNGSDERDMAEAYYDRCGYSWERRNA
jgi:hypothetical protein